MMTSRTKGICVWATTFCSVAVVVCLVLPTNVYSFSVVQSPSATTTTTTTILQSRTTTTTTTRLNLSPENTNDNVRPSSPTGRPTTTRTGFLSSVTATAAFLTMPITSAKADDGEFSFLTTTPTVSSAKSNDDDDEMSSSLTTTTTTTTPTVSAKEEDDGESSPLTTTTPPTVSVVKTNNSGDDDDDDSSSSSYYTITPCPSAGMSNANSCVSTSSTGRVAAFSPPWTFTCEPDQAYQTLLKLLQENEANNLGVKVTFIDPNKRYLKATAVRLGFTDQIEFLIRPQDKVVVYRSGDSSSRGSKGDLGGNKSRLEKLRKKSKGVFSVMGELEGDGDSYSNGGGNGIIGQLKAFYGLQSGEGYQDVFD